MTLGLDRQAISASVSVAAGNRRCNPSGKVSLASARRSSSESSSSRRARKASGVSEQTIGTEEVIGRF